MDCIEKNISLIIVGRVVTQLAPNQVIMMFPGLIRVAWLLCSMSIHVAANNEHNNLVAAFRGARKIGHHIPRAIDIEKTTHDYSSSYHLACVPYKQGPTLFEALQDLSSPDEYQVVLHSVKEDKTCYIVSGKCGQALESTGTATVTLIPQAVKYDESIDFCIKKLQNGDRNPFILEISTGIGVSGKGTNQDMISTLVKEIYHTSVHTLKDSEALKKHWRGFYWTKDYYTPARSLRNAHPDQVTPFAKLIARTDTTPMTCDYSTLYIEPSQSHVSLVAPVSFDLECMRFLASVAVQHPSVTFVQATLRTAPAAPSSEDYTTGDPATDQNSWVQSGTSTATPYSDIGVDGTGYVLGMIDSGLDDLSCFLIDWTGNQTTRTPGSEYANPITEPFRRKVIQYVMWGDGSPSVAGK